jgi:hypothetical protein
MNLKRAKGFEEVEEGFEEDEEVEERFVILFDF